MKEAKSYTGIHSNTHGTQVYTGIYAEAYTGIGQDPGFSNRGGLQATPTCGRG